MVASFAAPRILPSRLERFQGTMLGKVWKSAAHWGTDHLAAILPSGVMAERILMLKHRWTLNTAMNKCMQQSRWSKPLSVEFIWHVVVCWMTMLIKVQVHDLQPHQQIWFEVAKTMSGSWESAGKRGAAGLFMNSEAVCGFHPQDLTNSLRDMPWRGFRWTSGCKWPSS